MGNKDVEDALQKLDRLTQEEARMAAAELLKITHATNRKIDQANRSSSPYRYFSFRFEGSGIGHREAAPR